MQLTAAPAPCAADRFSLQSTNFHASTCLPPQSGSARLVLPVAAVVSRAGSCRRLTLLGRLGGPGAAIRAGDRAGRHPGRVPAVATVALLGPLACVPWSG